MDTFENEQPVEEIIPQLDTEPPVSQPEPIQEPVPAQRCDAQALPRQFTVPPQPQPVPVRPRPVQKKPAKTRWGDILFKVIVSFLLVGSILTNIVMGVMLLVVRNDIVKDVEAIRSNTEENQAVMEEKLEGLKGSEGNSVSGSPNTSADGLTPAQVYAQNADSVVAINCSVPSAYGQMISSGSGFVWSADGYIVSNHHVVDGAESITVVTNDGAEYAATYVGSDSSNDIALLKVEAQDLKAVTVGASSSLIVGDRVAAIGNALGELASTLTVGYVSAMDRIVTTEGSQINMIQTDAAINSGNSGGPLFNMKGEVIGITTAKYSGTSNSGASIEGIGFAIPMDDVIGMLEDLRDHGYITGGYLGVEVSNMDEADAKLYGLPMGVLVHKVTAGSCADKAGIKPRDILVELGGYTIENLNDLTRTLRNFDGGDTITAVVHRTSAGGEVVLTLTLDSKPAASSESASTIPDNGSSDEWFDHFFGE